MNDIMVVNGNELHIKEYKEQRVVTLWDISRLHNTTTTHIRNTFERQKKKNRLKENKNYYMVDKDSEFAHTFCMNKEIDPRALNPIKNIPIFTRSGYLMLTKSLDDDIAWKVQEELVDNYFEMQEVRQIIKNQLDPAMALETSKFIDSIATAAGVSPESRLAAAKNIYRLAGVELPIEITIDQKLFDLDQIAKRTGIFSNNGNPHVLAASEIIKRLNVPEEMKVITFEAKGNWQGSVTKYKEDILNMVESWLKKNKYPVEIDTGKRRLKVVYNLAS
jgi:hypothetical protein